MNLCEKRGADVRLILQITHDDIKIAKNRMWTSIVSALSMYGGIIAIEHKFNSDVTPIVNVKFCLSSFSFIIALYSIYHFIETHASIVRYRKKLIESAELLDEVVQKIYKPPCPKEEYLSFNRYFFGITLFFILSIIAGFLIVISYLYRADPNWLVILLILAFLIFFTWAVYFCHAPR